MASTDSGPPKRCHVQVVGNYNVSIITFKPKDTPNTIDVTINFVKNDKSEVLVFQDKFLLSDKHEAFLQSVVNTLYECISPKAVETGFLSFNAKSKSFAFKFQSEHSESSRTLNVVRSLFLNRSDYKTKELAIQRVLTDNQSLLNDPKLPHKITIHCINAHIIDAAQWDLEVVLSLCPGVHRFVIPDAPNTNHMIYLHDHRRIRTFYESKLCEYYSKNKIFRLYLDYLKSSTKLLWVQYHMECGTMDRLITALNAIESDEDEIWSDLFVQLCYKEYPQDQHINEEAVANFIALSIYHYCIHRGNAQNGTLSEEQKEEDLPQRELDEVDRYLLSIVMPYFEITETTESAESEKADKESKTPMFEGVDLSPINSGLFTNFIDFSNGMKIEAKRLKEELLFNLKQSANIEVIKRRWRFTSDGTTTFTAKAIVDGDGDDEVTDSDSNVITVTDTTFESQWAMWKNRGLKRQYPTSKGFWEIQDEYDTASRVPVHHLDVMRRLIEMDHVKMEEEEYKVTVTIFDFVDESGTKTEEKTGEYVIEFCAMNNQHCTVTIGCTITKAFTAKIDKNKKLKAKRSCFLYFKPQGLNHKVEWNWYDNDKAVYKPYDAVFGTKVPSQIEATYQGVQEYNFPIKHFHRKKDPDVALLPQNHLFTDGQLSEFAEAIKRTFGGKLKPYVMRFTFSSNNKEGDDSTGDSTTVGHGDGDDGGDLYSKWKVVNMEQVAVNPSGEKFPRNIRRQDLAQIQHDLTADVRVQDIGRMEVYLVSNRNKTTSSSSSAMLRWVFPENKGMGLQRRFEFECKMASSVTTKNTLNLWRENYLFDLYDAGVRKLKQDEDGINPVISGKTESQRFIPLEMPSISGSTKTRGDYKGILKQISNATMTDDEWDKLDILDDAKMKYMDRIEGFCDRVFTLISLQKVQSVISVMKQQIKSDEDLQQSPDPLIIAFSNNELLFQSTWKRTERTSFDTLFDGEATIKRVDSRGTIYNGEIEGFTKDVCSADKLYHFMQSASGHYSDSLFLFKRPKREQIHISYNGLNRKLSLLHYDEDLYYFLPSFITLSVGDYIDIEPFSYPDSGTVIERLRRGDSGDDQSLSIYYRVRASKSVFYTMTYHEITHRDAPEVYYDQIRPSLIGDNGSKMGMMHDMVSLVAEAIDDLKEKKKKLYDSKQQIMDYFKGNPQIDGDAFSKMNRKQIASIDGVGAGNANVFKSALIEKIESSTQNIKSSLFGELEMDSEGKDPSKEESHPLHIMTLSLFESSKHAISAVEKLTPNGMESIQNQLKRSGIIYLLFKTTINAPKDEDVIQLINDQTASIKANDDDTEIYIDPLLLTEFENSQTRYGGTQKLEQILTKLEGDKLISCRKRLNEEMTYFNLKQKNQRILNGKEQEQKVYVIHIVETRKLAVHSEGGTTVDAIEAGSDDGGGDSDHDDDDEDDQNWLTMADDGDGELKVSEGDTKKWIEIESDFEYKIEYELQMSSVYSNGTSIVELLEEKSKGLNEDQNTNSRDMDRLIALFHEQQIYNEFDLNDEVMNGVIKSYLDQNKHEPRDYRISLQFNALMHRLKGGNDELSTLQSAEGIRIVSGVEVTRNAVLLQQQYLKYLRATENEELKTNDMMTKPVMTMSSMTNDKGQEMKSMVITYNPLQSVVVTADTVTDITHPVHLYNAAYSKGMDFFFDDNHLDEISNDWMKKPYLPMTVSFLYKQSNENEPIQNMVDTLSKLLRYNKKYDIILVPSTVTLNQQYLDEQCFSIAPQIEAVAANRVGFLYKGIYYVRKQKPKGLNIGGDDAAKENNTSSKPDVDDEKDDQKGDDIDDNTDNGDDRGVDEEEGFFLDAVKFLAEIIQQNIVENARDWMDPLDPERAKSGDGLRSIIHRNNKDVPLRWVKIGCGSCFLHDLHGGQNEIGPPKAGGDKFDAEFSKLFREALFLYGIDCHIPSMADDLKEEDPNRCGISGKYMVNPRRIIESKCGKPSHRFDALSIQYWMEMVDNPYVGTLKTFDSEPTKAEFKFDGTLDNPDDPKQSIKIREELGLKDERLMRCSVYLPKYCPLFWQCAECNEDGDATNLGTEGQMIKMEDIEELKQDDDGINGLPMTIREQLETESDRRYRRMKLVNDYQQLQEWLTTQHLRTSEDTQPKIRMDYDHQALAMRNPQYAQMIAAGVNKFNADDSKGIDWDNAQNKTLAQLIKENPQIEMDLAGITNESNK